MAKLAEFADPSSRSEPDTRPDDDDSAPEVRRLNTDAATTLEQFQRSPLLEHGQINLLALDAIVERLGPKWEVRRQAVYEYTRHTLERHVGESGLYLRVSDSDFMVILPGEGKYAGQLRCIQYLREVLNHFVGESLSGNVAVRRVTSISRSGIEAVLIDPEEARLGAAKEKSEDGEAPRLAGTVDRWTPFVASNGRRVRVSCVLEPVFELKSYTRIGNRIARRVLAMDTEQPLSIDETQRLSRSDIERIDLATIARGLDRLSNEAGAGDQLSLIVPASYVSLSNRNGRTALADSFAEARRFVKTGVMCEIRDIEGVPQLSLIDATSMIKSFSMLMIGGLAAAPDRGHGNLRGAGLQALSFEAPLAIVGDAEFGGWARDAIRAAKLIAKSVIIYRLNSPRHAAIAALLGASHASLRVEGKSGL